MKKHFAILSLLFLFPVSSALSADLYRSHEFDRTVTDLTSISLSSEYVVTLHFGDIQFTHIESGAVHVTYSGGLGGKAVASSDNAVFQLVMTENSCLMHQFPFREIKSGHERVMPSKAWNAPYLDVVNNRGTLLVVDKNEITVINSNTNFYTKSVDDVIIAAAADNKNGDNFKLVDRSGCLWTWRGEANAFEIESTCLDSKALSEGSFFSLAGDGSVLLIGYEDGRIEAHGIKRGYKVPLTTIQTNMKISGLSINADATKFVVALKGNDEPIKLLNIYDIDAV